jgi:hypothetical protein
MIKSNRTKSQPELDSGSLSLPEKKIPNIIRNDQKKISHFL